MTDSALRHPPLFTRLWRRKLDHYPATGPRAWYLTIVVIATITLYYELYVQGAVATQIIDEFDMTLRYFVVVAIVGNAAGALASVIAGLADRWGRANLVVVGLLITALIILIGLPNATDRNSYTLLFTALSFVEGMVLVATPALIRDFSPQLGRASAMGFWTLGPVLGSLVVSTVSSRTLPTHPDWRFQFVVCGLVGLGAFGLALIGLRELSPRLRDQLMVSLRDRTLIEARAAGIDPERETDRDRWRRVFRADVVWPAFAISVFLLFYYFAVGFFVVYYAIQFGYSEARANALANWYWVANALALVVAGITSDAFQVRKPFMIFGGLVSASGVAMFAILTTRPETSYYTFAWLLVMIASGGGIAYCAWMAAFTETVEKHDPAATATGLAIWGSVLRGVVTVSLIGLVIAVPSANALVDHGPEVRELAAKYEAEVATAAKLSAPTADTLASDPDNPVVQAVAVAEIADLPVTTVAAVLITQQKYPDLLKAYTSLRKPLGTYFTYNVGTPEVQAIIWGQVLTAMDEDVARAQRALSQLRNPPPDADLDATVKYGQRVNAAASQLVALSRVPADDLAYLQAHGADVARAREAAPHEWQRWWWVAFAGQIVFLPFVFLLTGRWNPARAMRDAQLHEQAVARELAALHEQRGS
ncbi:MFS transporter [Cryptosporangium aurantiacum]|uniref:Sugar phosphate permease n=1 Tax=Cryptosporangium aurantiacum TaxID=134849 RepID=A0A1M7JJ72_9ACTN|nr:MFS transporter [Cryptosporangium aurantiacum]SHM52941.1 Sugar phosphate permease [Cryptosporangium aurantiacum]